MAKIMISGDLKEQDIWVIAKFFREFWRHRTEKIFMLIEEGVGNLTKEQTMDIFKQVFSGDTDWTTQKISQEMIKEFEKSVGVKNAS